MLFACLPLTFHAVMTYGKFCKDKESPVVLALVLAFGLDRAFVDATIGPNEFALTMPAQEAGINQYTYIYIYKPIRCFCACLWSTAVVPKKV